ncbi:MAG TPA: N-6 DNA methylase [Terriglobales bacterium]|nr:N-6 DNA methylase [Terriglobales bacterium]
MKEAGEHFTPREVIRLMVNLLLGATEPDTKLNRKVISSRLVVKAAQKMAGTIPMILFTLSVTRATMIAFVQ